MCILCTVGVGIVLLVIGCVIFLAVNNKYGKKKDAESSAWYSTNHTRNSTILTAHDFKDHLSHQLLVNTTCYNLIRKKGTWNIAWELCQQNQFILEDSKMETANLYWVPEEYFHVFNVYNGTLSLPDNGTCYDFQQVDVSYTFSPVDCADFLPWVCEYRSCPGPLA